MNQQNLTESTWREVRAAGAHGIALLPIGSQEQHAAHLPMGTDTLLVEAVVDRAADLLARDGGPADPELVRLPALPFGHSPHHLFAAAVSLGAATLGAVLDDVLDSLAASGYRRVMVVNGHGGNDEIMRLAVKRFALRADVTVAACSYWTLGAAANVPGTDGSGTDGSGAAETAEAAGPGTGQAGTARAGTGSAEAAGGERPEVTPGHAGWFETSLMLAAHPRLVRTPVPARAPVEPPPLFDHPPFPGLSVERHGEWARVGGSTDDASSARAERGARLLDARAAGLARAIRAFDEATR